MKTGIGIVVALAVVLGGLVALNKHKKAKAAAEYEELLRTQQAARYQVGDKYRAAATKKLAAIRAAIKDAASAAPVPATEPLSAPLKEAPVLTALDGYEGDTVLAGIAQPEAVQRTLVPSFAPRFEKFLGPPPATPSSGDTTAIGVEEDFVRFDKVRLALLVRLHEVQPPSVAAGGRFVGGTAKGDAALYDLATGMRLGAFPFEVVQSDTARIAKHDDADAQLLQSFMVNVNQAVKKELEAFVGGKPGAAAPGAADAASLERFGDKIRLEIGLPYAAAMVRSVTVARGGGGRALVTIYADSPKLLLPGGKVSAGIAESVKKVLGAEADIAIEPAPGSP